MQPTRWSGTENSQEMPESSHCMMSLAEPWHGWTTLIANGALTPGLLSALILTVGFTTTLTSAQAAPVQVAASDANAPVVSIVRPTHADQLRGTEQIQISVKAGRYPAQSLEMYVDDRMATPGAVTLDASMLPVAVFNWDTRVFADGPHRLSVVIADSQGFKTRANVQVYINNRGEQDIVPPSVRWLNVHHGDPIKGDFPVQVEATDNFGVKWVIISLNRAISPASKPPFRAVMVNKPPYILRLRPDLPADTYVLTATAWDAKDNRGDAPPIQIFYQPKPGPITIPVNPIWSHSGGFGGLGTPSPPKPSQPDAPVEENTGVVPPPPVFDPSQPRLSKAVPDKMAGESGLIPPEVADVIAHAGLSKRDVFIAKIHPSTPRVEAREVPLMPPVLTPARAARAEMTGQIVGSTASPTPQRLASTSKPHQASQPMGESKLVPGLGAVTRAPRAAEPSSPAVPVAPSALRAPRIATLNAVQPPAMSRIAAPSAVPTPVRVAPQTASAPQLAHSTLSGTSIARPAEVRPRAATPSTTLASVPPALLRRTEQAPPQLTPMDAASPSIARPFPDMQARPARGPWLAVLPKGAMKYPSIPSFELRNLPPVVAPPAKVIGLPPSLPKNVPSKIAMNSPMPGRSARPRVLASITVAPQSEWGTLAEVLPVSHLVRRDETLSSIARRYQMPVAVLAAANNLKATSKMSIGAQLSLPRSLRVTYAGQPVKTDAASFMMGSVGVTPFRFLFEKQGGKLKWDAKTHRVTASGGGNNVSITVGSRSAVINQKEVLMDLAAFLMSGRTMVPLRFFEQALQARVDWDPATGRIFVAMSGPAAT